MKDVIHTEWNTYYQISVLSNNKLKIFDLNENFTILNKDEVKELIEILSRCIEKMD